MQSIGDYPAYVQRQKRAPRRAFGAQRPMTEAQKAQYVAESIILREDDGVTWTWATYGLDGNAQGQALVAAALTRIRDGNGR